MNAYRQRKRLAGRCVVRDRHGYRGVEESASVLGYAVLIKGLVRDVRSRLAYWTARREQSQQNERQATSSRFVAKAATLGPLAFAGHAGIIVRNPLRRPDWTPLLSLKMSQFRLSGAGGGYIPAVWRKSLNVRDRGSNLADRQVRRVPDEADQRQSHPSTGSYAVAAPVLAEG